MIEMVQIGEKNVSDDRSLEIMAAMMIQKDFGLKKLIESFVHRHMASGLYFKDNSDSALLYKYQYLLKYTENDTSKRKLTLTDFAPAFIFLLIRYFMSFSVFLYEIMLNRKTGVKFSMKKNKRKQTICNEESM